MDEEVLVEEKVEVLVAWLVWWILIHCNWWVLRALRHLATVIPIENSDPVLWAEFLKSRTLMIQNIYLGEVVLVPLRNYTRLIPVQLPEITKCASHSGSMFKTLALE